MDSRNIKSIKTMFFDWHNYLIRKVNIWMMKCRGGDMEQFLLKMENEMIDLKSIGVSGSTKCKY